MICYRARGRGNAHQLAVEMGTSVTMLEKHYSKLTPMLMADEFAGRNYIEREKQAAASTAESKTTDNIAKGS